MTFEKYSLIFGIVISFIAIAANTFEMVREMFWVRRLRRAHVCWSEIWERMKGRN